MASKIDQIAEDMQRMLKLTEARYVHYKLPRGLELVLARTERGYRLALGRTDAQPSDTEIQVCQAAFKTPPDVEPVRTVKTRLGKSGPRTYHVAEMTWSEVN